MSKYVEYGQQIGELVESKQKQYGDAVSKTTEILKVYYPNGIRPDQYSDVLLMVRSLDKFSRISQRGENCQDLGGESPWKDVSGYGILGWSKDENKVVSGKGSCYSFWVNQVEHKLYATTSIIDGYFLRRLANVPDTHDIWIMSEPKGFKLSDIGRVDLKKYKHFFSIHKTVSDETSPCETHKIWINHKEFYVHGNSLVSSGFLRELGDVPMVHDLWVMSQGPEDYKVVQSDFIDIKYNHSFYSTHMGTDKRG